MATQKRKKPVSKQPKIAEVLAKRKVANEKERDPRIRLLRRQIANLKKHQDEKVTGVDILRDAFHEAYTKPLNIRIQPPPSSRAKTGIEVPILPIFDVHFGKKTETYDSYVAAERMMLLAQKVAQIINIRRSHAQINELHIYLGGDLAEGEGAIFPGQQHEIDMDIIDQCAKFGPAKMAELVIYLLQSVQKLVIKGVPGNHGRNGDKNAPKRHNYDSWFYHVLRMTVEIALQKNHKKRLADITWDLPFDRPKGKEWYALDRVLGWGNMIAHGNQIMGQLGFPWYGFGKKVSGWAGVVPEPFDYLYTGHFHTEARFDLNKRTVLASASPESSNAHAAENHAAGGYPKQRMCIYNKKYGLISDEPIYLDLSRRPA